MQRRFRDFNIEVRVEDIYDEHVTEDELVEMVKYAKMTLLERYKKYNLESTKKNILKVQTIFDLNRMEEQYDNALRIAIEHLELVLQTARSSTISKERANFIYNEAMTACRLLKAFREK